MDAVKEAKNQVERVRIPLHAIEIQLGYRGNY